MRLPVAFLLLSATAAVSQTPPVQPGSTVAVSGLPALNEQLDRHGKALLASISVTVEVSDYTVDDRRIEALVVRPAGADGRHPALFLIPGHGRSARDNLPLAVQFARSGYVVMTVSQPGYGRSEGAPDFVGPATMAALTEGARRLSARDDVEPSRMGVYGYSRGALAAALLAVRTPYFRAGVFGGGVYDFDSAYRDIRLEEIRANMATEAGTTPEAATVRSPLREMERLTAPVLIIHGAEDVNAPLSEAQALAARLTALDKPHEMTVVPGKGHALALRDVLEPALAFFNRTIG